MVVVSLRGKLDLPPHGVRLAPCRNTSGNKLGKGMVVMSHTMGVMCVLHKTVMVSDITCPEMGCKGSHGYGVAACDARCPKYVAPPATTDTALRWPELQGAMRARDVFARALAGPMTQLEQARRDLGDAARTQTRKYLDEFGLE